MKNLTAEFAEKNEKMSHKDAKTQRTTDNMKVKKKRKQKM